MNAPACTRLFQPQHHYSSPSGKTVHRRQEISPRRWGAAFAVGGRARRARGGRPAVRHPFGVKIPGSGGAPPCLAAARSACAGSFPWVGATARRLLLPSWVGRPAGPGQAGPADAGTGRRGGAARGTGPHPRAGADGRTTARNAVRIALWSAGRGPARADRRCAPCSATFARGSGHGKSPTMKGFFRVVHGFGYLAEGGEVIGAQAMRPCTGG